MSAAGVNGIVLTKLDGTAKGGVAVAIAHDLEAADPLRRHRREHRRSRAVFAARVRRRALRGDMVAPADASWRRALALAERGRGRTTSRIRSSAASSFRRRRGSSAPAITNGRVSRTRRSTPFALPVIGRAARRSIARSSRAATRAAPVRASPPSPPPASGGWSPPIGDPNPAVSGRGFAYLRAARHRGARWACSRTGGAAECAVLHCRAPDIVHGWC